MIIIIITTIIIYKTCDIGLYESSEAPAISVLIAPGIITIINVINVTIIIIIIVILIILIVVIIL